MTAKSLSLLFYLSLLTRPTLSQVNSPSDSGNITLLPNSTTEIANSTSPSEPLASKSPFNSTMKPPTNQTFMIDESQLKLDSGSYDSQYDYCSCDLKPGFCDINCCCDEDCDEDDRRIFAFCESIKHSKQSDNHCFTEYPVFLNNTKNSRLETSSNLFCILTDNVKNFKSYPDRKSVTSVQEYRKILSSGLTETGSTLFSWSHPHEITEPERANSFTVGKGFHYGDVIVATSVTPRGVEINDIFRLPGSLISSQGFCDTLKPILYLKDSSHTCLRDIKDFQKDCTSNSFLGASIYYENIWINKMGVSKSMTPETRTYYQIENIPADQQTNKSISESSTSTSPVPSSNVASSKQTKLLDSKLSPVPNCVYLNECVTIDWPEKNTSQTIPRLSRLSTTRNIICQGAVETVNYTFYYHPKVGIDSVRLSIHFTQLTDNQPVKQTFNVAFLPSEDYLVNKTLPRFEYSGNAGYIFGKPILFRNSSLSSPNSSTEIGHYYIPQLTKGNGHCLSKPPILTSVKFGTNHRTGCLLNTSRFFVENQMCQSIQKEILNLLDGLNRDLTYVAMFGNPNATNPSDWIPILVDDEPQLLQSDSVPRLTADERCPALVTGYSLDIYYALVGSESQSQAKIISVIKRFNKPIDFRLRCHSLICRHKANSYLLELSISVNYIDLTLPIETKFAPPPILRFQLPYDFFYPFMTNSDHHSSNEPQITLFCTLIMFIIPRFIIDTHF